MNRSELRTLFDKAILLPRGERIRITCRNKSHSDSIRGYMYKQRRSMEAHFPAVRRIEISREITPDGVFIYLSSQYDFSESVDLMRPDGTTEALQFDPAKEELPPPRPEQLPLTPEQERMQQLMREDGKTEDEIAAALGR